MAQAHTRKKMQMTRKRARLRGTPLGVWVRLRMAWTAADMSSVSDGASVDSLSHCRRWRGDLSKSGSTGGRQSIRENDLTGLRLGKPKLVGHLIDAAGLRELGFAQVQLGILLAQLVESLLFALNAVAAFNGAEMLQAVNHDEREERDHGGREHAH